LATFTQDLSQTESFPAKGERLAQRLLKAMKPLFSEGTRIYVPITHVKTKQKVLAGDLTKAPILSIYHEAGYQLRQIIVQTYETLASKVRMIVEVGDREAEIERLNLNYLGELESKSSVPNPF